MADDELEPIPFDMEYDRFKRGRATFGTQDPVGTAAGRAKFGTEEPAFKGPDRRCNVRRVTADRRDHVRFEDKLKDDRRRRPGRRRDDTTANLWRRSSV